MDLPDAPVGMPANFETHPKLLFDLQALAFKREITRISTLMLALENSNAVYPATGIREGRPPSAPCAAHADVELAAAMLHKTGARVDAIGDSTEPSR